MAHIGQSRPDYGLGVQLKVLNPWAKGDEDSEALPVRKIHARAIANCKICAGKLAGKTQIVKFVPENLTHCLKK